jgi:Helix-turn-helix domain of transposase family ISL3
MKRYTNISKQEIEHLLLENTITDTANILGISKSTLVRRMKEYQIPHPVYIQSAETRKLRSESLKKAHIADPTLAQRQTKAIQEHSICRKGKSNIEFYGLEKAKLISEQQRISHLGYKHTQETKYKFTQQRTGRTLSSFHRANVSRVRKENFANGSLKLSPKAGFGKGGFRKDIGHYVRSSYEHNFALWLLQNGLSYEYEPKTFTLIIDNQLTTFTPDFWVGGYWLEIKNSYNINVESFQSKIKAFKSQYPNEVIFVIIGNHKWHQCEAIEETINSQSDLVEVVATLKQVLCVKG